ncbi:MAG TPA: LamG-like jellyroll fold domain-containing protein, partial [Planctomycetota bacterium]|nr:LamG-like jellyroll fold domain-containing protein [Planctomycetota bacterium]
MHRHLRSVVALVACAGAVAAQQVPEILYYKLNDGGGTLALNEASPGAGFTQAVVNGAFTFGPGQLGGGLVGTGQTGANAYVDTGYTLNLQGTSWTLEFWYTPTSYPSLQYLMGVPVGGSFRVYGAAQGGSITLTGSGLGTVSATGAMPPIGTWVHIAYVFDATTTPPRVTPYVNGAPLAPVNQTGTLTLNTGAFRLGSQI